MSPVRYFCRAYFYFMKKLLLLPAVFIPLFLCAQGMWVPLLLDRENGKEMHALGLKIKPDELYQSYKPSIKDAICQFDGGCTAAVISPDGLLLTNHHCGFDAVQALSTPEHNYIENGYFAGNRSEEMPAKGVTAMFVVRMENVTTLALQGVAENMAESDRQSQIDKNLASIKSSTKKEKWEDVMIRPFYNGNQYYLFITQTFRDVRFVGAPPSSIGKFGADTDNWVWPRHAGDFSMFRIYSDKDGHPADYASDNIPYHPRHFLPISLNGVAEGDFTMVYGFPGRTSEYLPAAAVRQTGEVLDPARVAIREQALKVLDGYMRKDSLIKIAYVARYAHIANAWKKWKGEMQGLKTWHALDKKNQYEAEFTRRIQLDADLKYRYGNLLPRLNQLYHDMEPYVLARDYYYETCVRNNEILPFTGSLNAIVEVFNKNGDIFARQKIRETGSKLDDFFKNYRPEVDEPVLAAMLEMFAENTNSEWGGGWVKTEAGKHGGYAAYARYIFQNSVVPNRQKLQDLFAKSPSDVVATLSSDPAWQLWKQLNDAYQVNVQPKLQEIQPRISLLERQYMEAQMRVFQEKRFYPDANSTLRLTYGKVEGYTPRDAIRYEFQTHLDGVMEKYIPGDYEFDVPKKLIDLWKSKDYGQYANADGRLPVNFLGTNHTTGGNSGSPVLDARGNLVGLNFDRVWEGTMSDLNYDPAICRNIMVDIRYVLFIVDKFAGAGYLLDEMKLVKGKKRK